MEQDKTIPYYAHEGIMARMERSNRRLWILCIILIVLLAVTNGKLAAYYTILDHITEQEPRTVYSDMASYSAGSSAIEYEGESDFAKVIKGRDPGEVWPVIDELMTTIQVIHPRLYTGVMAKLQ